MQPDRCAVLVGLAAAVLVSIYAANPTALTPRPQEPTFRSSVDLIAVDVQVVDNAGRPVSGLTAANFEVTIGGRRRQVVSADYTQYRFAGPPPERLGSVPVPRNIWPVQEAGSAGPGRTFVVAVDAASFSPGDTVGVTRAVNEFVNRLQDQDLIGVFTLPHGTALTPTADRIQFRQALAKVSGWQGTRANRYNLTPVEVMEITAADGQMEGPAVAPVGRGGAPVPPGTDNNVLRQVQLRECRGQGDASCLQGILMEAAALGREYEEQVTESLVGLNALLGQLANFPGRKTVVLVSAGMPVSDRPGSWYSDGGQARALGRAAAQANATVYSLHVDQGYRSVYSAEARTSRPTFSAARERQLSQLLLNEFAVASGGALLSVATGAGEMALDRLLFETSAYYLLGISPDQLDLDGRTHELRVKVDRRGAMIRARRFVVLRPTS